jgi:hypothetical protein
MHPQTSKSLNGIRTHDPSIRVSEDSSCLKLHGHCDWHCLPYFDKIQRMNSYSWVWDIILIEFIFLSNVCDAECKQYVGVVVMDFPVTLLMIDRGV